MSNHNTRLAPFIGKLAKLPFFSTLSEDALDTLCRGATGLSLSPGRSFNFGANLKNALIVILEGRLQVIEHSAEGKASGLDHVARGGMIGWLSVIDNQPMRDVYRADEPTEAILLAPQACHNLLFTNSVFNRLVMSSLVDRIRKLKSDRDSLTMPNAFQRVFYQIQNSVEHLPADQTATPLAKQHELASIANTSRETVSRALQYLVKHGILEKNGRCIIVRRADQLKKLAIEGPDT